MQLHHFCLCVSSAAAVAMLTPRTPAQTLLRSVNGPAANSMYGKACIRVPDQNSDGFDDLLVGVPGYNSQRGAIFCLSGAYLALGTGTQTLWALAPTANPGDLFGNAIANVGDHTADGVDDFLVGQPGYDVSGANDVGAIRLVNGLSHTTVSLIHGAVAGCAFGTAVASCGNPDGHTGHEAAVGAPGTLGTDNRFYLVQGDSLDFTGSVSVLPTDSYGVPSSEIGASIAGGFDLDGDGHPELVVGAPGAFTSTGGLQAGAAYIFEVSSLDQLSLEAVYPSSIAGERMGASVDAAHDYDGDGVVDIIVGAPNSPDAGGNQSGRVVVLSGARLAAGTLPYEVYTLMPGVVSHVGQTTFDTRFGAAVCASGDLNNDGVGEILVGSPDYFTGFGATPKGVATIFSGASGARWTHVFGISGEQLGSSITGAIEDLDGDGFREFVVAGSLSDAGGTDSGVVKCYKLFPIVPGTYCTGKLNSLGCTPAIWFSGTPKVIPTGPFLINAISVMNQKSGLLFYSHTPASQSFQGGFKCAGDPVRRMPVLNSGGSASGSDCTGTYSVDFTEKILGGSDPSLVAGAEVFTQWWSRDPGAASKTSLSNALRFVINP